jgi:hypothetical protein
MDKEELIKLLESFDKINSCFKNDSKYGFDLMPDDFALTVRPLKTQIYGLRVQGYFAHHLNFILTPSSMDLGDFRTPGGHDIEFKVSFLDNDSQSINCKQIRNWQDLDFYYVFTINYSNYRDIIFKCYELTKEQMIEECSLVNAKPVANVSSKNDSEHASLGFSIKVGSEHYRRWEEKYLNKKFDIRKVVSDNLKRIHTDKEKDELIMKQHEIIKQMEEKIKALELAAVQPKPEEISKDDPWWNEKPERSDNVVTHFRSAN